MIVRFSATDAPGVDGLSKCYSNLKYPLICAFWAAIHENGLWQARSYARLVHVLAAFVHLVLGKSVCGMFEMCGLVKKIMLGDAPTLVGRESLSMTILSPASMVRVNIVLGPGLHSVLICNTY